MEYQEQPVSNAKTNEFTNMGMSHLDSDVIKFIHDNYPQLEILENQLLGKKMDFETSKWQTDVYSTKRLNEKGVRHLMSDMCMRISNITSLGKLDDMQINKMIKRYGFLISLWLFQYKNEWDIKKDIDRSMIMRLLVDTYFITLNKSSGGWAGNALSRMYTRSETFQERPQQKKGLRRLLPF